MDQKSLFPQISIQVSVLSGFRDVFLVDVPAMVNVRNCPADLKYFIITPCRDVEFSHGLMKQPFRPAVQ